MQLEDYFEFEKFSTKHGEVVRIRIKGHRIAIEHVLYYYKEEKMGPEQIVREVYTDLPLEAAYATILYYLHNKETVEAYLEQGERIANAWYQEYLEKGPYFLRDEAQARIAAEKAADSR
ncbi:MAG TPA: DUF433 domain-containing protein [Gemmataceae bacterium]|nr:DUF433 domain-containing protein [Gemmataceae bacterium]